MLAVAAIFILPIPLLNYLVDPLWCFGHVIPFGRYQAGFDERQQKTNFLTFNEIAYDTLILGSSRVTYTDPRDVPGKAFNYATSSMRSSEFLPYLRFAADRNSNPLKTIVLGISFYETNGANHETFSAPAEYITKAASPGYRYKTLFSLGLFRHSLSNIKRDILAKGRLDAYKREGREVLGRQMPLPIPENALRIAISENVNAYRERVYGKSYEYLDIKPTFAELKSAFPDARFLVFTTPVSAHLLRLLVEQGRIEDYKRWFSGVVEVFSEAWNFMYFNEVTLNEANYKDAHHYSPKICRAIIRRIYDLPYDDQFSDFGVRVTAENLEKHLAFLGDNMTKLGCDSFLQEGNP